MKKGLGWIPDDIDKRDRLATLDTLGASPGAQADIDLEGLLPDVLDQGGDRSCVTQSVAGAVYAARVPHETEPELLSRKALWWLARKEQGLEKHNRGMQIRQAFRILNNTGFCRERHWGHDKPLDKRPDIDASSMHVDQRNKGEGRVEYQRLDGLYGDKLQVMDAALASGHPFPFGVYVSNDFANGLLDFTQPIPPPLEDLAGGHAMLCYGRRNGLYLVRNSWGRDWGISGNCLFTPEYMMLAADKWIALSAPAFSDTL